MPSASAVRKHRSSFLEFRTALICVPQPRRGRASRAVLRLPLTRFEKAHGRAKFFVVMICPPANASKRGDKGPAQFGQGILDRNRFGVFHSSGDECRRFKVAQCSRKHSLGDVSKATQQLPVAMWPFLESGNNLDCPLADENRGDPFRPALSFVLHFLQAMNEKGFQLVEPTPLSLHFSRASPHVASLSLSMQAGTRMCLLDRHLFLRNLALPRDCKESGS